MFKAAFALFVTLSVRWVYACSTAIYDDLEGVIRQNNNARLGCRSLPTGQTTAIRNVRVFDGEKLGELTTVYIHGSHISKHLKRKADVSVDGQGGTLLPGLIDSHCHPMSLDDVRNLTRYGVTTAFQLSCYSPELCASLAGHQGLTDMHLGSAAAAAPGSLHGNITLAFSNDTSLLVRDSDDADRWVREQLPHHPEFIKIVAETPGMDQTSLGALTEYSHSHGKQVVCHAADLKSQWQAVRAGVDHVHHMPADTEACEDLAALMLQKKQISVPTLTVMKALAMIRPGRNYTASSATALRYYKAGIPILAGTDANAAIVNVEFGKSLHEELGLLTAAGVPTMDVLNAATSRAAKLWGLHDRGSILPGKRADLLLVKGDPTADIAATKNIMKIWIAGQEVTLPVGTF